MAGLMFENITIKKDILNDEKYKYLFSVEAVNDLVNKGIPFRDAYKQVGNSIEAGDFDYNDFQAAHHIHEGSMGNLHNDEIKAEMGKILGRM